MFAKNSENWLAPNSQIKHLPSYSQGQVVQYPLRSQKNWPAVNLHDLRKKCVEQKLFRFAWLACSAAKRLRALDLESTKSGFKVHLHHLLNLEFKKAM